MDYYFKEMEPPSAIILGCTHFPLISDAIYTYFNEKPTIIHSGEAIVEYLQSALNLTSNYHTTELKLFASENPDGLKKVALQWMNK